MNVSRCNDICDARTTAAGPRRRDPESRHRFGLREVEARLLVQLHPLPVRAQSHHREGFRRVAQTVELLQRERVKRHRLRHRYQHHLVALAVLEAAVFGAIVSGILNKVVCRITPGPQA